MTGDCRVPSMEECSEDPLTHRLALGPETAAEITRNMANSQKTDVLQSYLAAVAKSKDITLR